VQGVHPALPKAVRDDESSLREGFSGGAQYLLVR
jgi:hypothetical protein